MLNFRNSFHLCLFIAVALLIFAGCSTRTDQGIQQGMDNGSQSSGDGYMPIPPTDPGWEPLRTVVGEPLSPEEIQDLLARLPDLEIEEGDQVAFKRRERSMPPPLTGEDLKEGWPPDLSDPKVQAPPSGPLKVQAFRPSGEVEAPFQVAISFDRPVVAVGAVLERPIPEVSLSPAIDGRWRWLGTQTLVFEPTDKWPGATEFELRLQPGLKSVDGSTLAEEVAFEFSTPAPKVATIYPPNSGTQRSDAPVVIVFDQRIDPQTAHSVEIEANRRVHPMRLLEGEEKEEALKAYSLMDEEIGERALAFAPTEEYPDSALVRVRVNAPIASLEGPVLGTLGGQAQFRVRGPFEIVEVRCSNYSGCRPGSVVVFLFSNSVETAGEPPQFTAVPAVENLSVSVYRDRVHVSGNFQPYTTYEITAPGDLEDIHGQKIQGTRSHSVKFDGHPSFISGPNSLVVVRPTDGAMTLPVMLTEIRSLRARVYKTSVGEWARFQKFHSERETSPWLNEASSEVYRFSREERRSVQELGVDLSAAFEGRDTGHAMVILDDPKPWHYSGSQRWVYWVQRTDLAAQISSDMQELTVQVTSLSTGEPVVGARMSFGGDTVVITDEHGQGRIQIPGGDLATKPLIIEKEGDSLLIPVNGQVHWFSNHQQWATRDPYTNHLWYIVDDRQVYKPGETVKIRGWVRSQESSPRSSPKNTHVNSQLTYTVREPRYNEIAQGEVRLDAFGGFEFEFSIPEGANLGQGYINFSLSSGGSAVHSFQIQEFRRPEYEVTLEAKTSTHIAGQESYLEAQASYYAGGGLVGAPARWSFQESAGRFQPAGWSGWQFGVWTPWWWNHFPGYHSGEVDYQVLPAEFYQGVENKTDGTGRAGVVIPFEHSPSGLARNIRATVSIIDVNRQSWEATESFLVHPAANYVGLRSEETFVQRDKPWVVEAVAVDIDGKAVPGLPIEIEIRRERSGEIEVVQTCTKTSAENPISCSFSDLSPGMYRARATVKDAQGRQSESYLSFWVAGQDRRGAKTAEEDSLLLIPNKEVYQVGETASVLVQSPYYPLNAIVELRRDGRYERRLERLTEEDPTVKIAIEEEMIPNIHVSVQALAGGDAYEMDAFAAGTVDLKIDRSPKKLTVDIQPDAEAISPGAELGVEVFVKDSAGEAVEGAQVLLFAVDEAVLSLSNYSLGDPLSVFFPERAAQMSDIQSRNWLLLLSEDEQEKFEDLMNKGQGASGFGGAVLESEEMASGAVRRQAARPAPMAMAAPQADAGVGGGRAQQPEPISLREVFDALAFYKTDLITDGQGRISHRVKMPESLTRYRIMAVAVYGDEHFGHGEKDVTARLPLMVRPSEPRFLNVGDEFEFAVVVQNQTLEPMTVDLALRTSPNMQWRQPPGRRVVVPGADRVEVRFPARALTAGTARVQIAGASGVYADAALVDFPILTPATTEAFATYGSLFEEDAILQAVQVPEDAYAEYGGLEFSASSTQLQALTDAFIYLCNYPFQSSEHLASRILSVLALRDVLEAFEAPGVPDAKTIDTYMESWLERLIRMQHSDGGFGFWEGSSRTWPYITVHVAFALYQAQEAGYSLPSGSLERTHTYLRSIERHLRDYSPRTKATVEAYALYVRYRMSSRFGQVEARELDQLITKYGIEELSLESLGWLLPLAKGTQWEERFMQRIMGQVQETAATAEFQETYSSGAYQILHTWRRTDGVVLDGLLQVEPGHHLVEKVVRGLLAHRTRGRWANTQENVFILMALRRYFDEYESTTPDFIARAWLGEEQIGEHTFKGRTTERYHVQVPMSYLQEGDDTQPVVIQRDGEGRLYYRLGVNYAPKSRYLPPLNEGFHVERTYLAVDNEEDVSKDAEGNWVIKAGARVQVQLIMNIPARRYHVALVDWLPAGFEPINTALAVSAVEPGLAGGSSDYRFWRGWWGWPWYEHQNMRDERVEAFASIISQGAYTYTYMVRATTPGTFIAMPAKAEELYHPETFGRSATEVVKVVE